MTPVPFLSYYTLACASKFAKYSSRLTYLSLVFTGSILMGGSFAERPQCPSQYILPPNDYNLYTLGISLLPPLPPHQADVGCWSSSSGSVRNQSPAAYLWFLWDGHALPILPTSLEPQRCGLRELSKLQTHPMSWIRLFSSPLPFVASLKTDGHSGIGRLPSPL